MVEVKFDNTLEFPTIEMPIYNESPDVDPEVGSDGVLNQTKVDGIFAPLFKINDIVIQFHQVSYMSLRCDNVPTLSVTIEDSMAIIKTLDTPTNDNKLQMQILPQFDGAYKKINLIFYMTNVEIEGFTIHIDAVYNPPDFRNMCMESFGELSTYEFFEQVSKKYKLGFCSNVSGTNDKRYIYSANNTIQDLMNKEIEYAGEDKHVFGYWIDFWNNINLVDLYNEYKLIEPDENLQIWIQSIDYNTSDTSDNYEPVKMTATIGNAPNLQNTQLYVTEYTPTSSSPDATDKIIEIFNMVDKTSESIAVIDGDIKKDVTKKYVYFGENVGETKYLYQKATRDMFLSKLNGQNIEVSLPRPMLGLMKGGKVNFYYYDINRYISQETSEGAEISSNVKVPEDIITPDSKYILNKTVSGQYYIADVEIVYNQGSWSQWMKLGRYADEVNKYVE